MGSLRCWLFGHTFQTFREGLLGLNAKTVCTRCGETLPGFIDQDGPEPAPTGQETDMPQHPDEPASGGDDEP